jgi:hypothetical protein
MTNIETGSLVYWLLDEDEPQTSWIGPCLVLSTQSFANSQIQELRLYDSKENETIRVLDDEVCSMEEFISKGYRAINS